MDQRQTMRRPHRLTASLNEKEYEAIDRYCKKYKIQNRSKLIRDMIFSQIFDSYSRDYPTLWDRQVMAELVVEKR